MKYHPQINSVEWASQICREWVERAIEAAVGIEVARGQLPPVLALMRKASPI